MLEKRHRFRFQDKEEGRTHIEDVQVVVDQILHDLHLVLALPVGLEQAGGEQQRQVLGAHLVQIGTLLDPGTGSEKNRESVAVFSEAQLVALLEGDDDTVRHDDTVRLDNMVRRDIIEYLTQR